MSTCAIELHFEFEHPWVFIVIHPFWFFIIFLNKRLKWSFFHSCSIFLMLAISRRDIRFFLKDGRRASSGSMKHSEGNVARGIFITLMYLEKSNQFLISTVLCREKTRQHSSRDRLLSYRMLSYIISNMSLITGYCVPYLSVCLHQWFIHILFRS